MPAFRILNQFPVFHDRAGRLADGGRLEFFATDTTTPKAVFGDPGLTVNNGSTVVIGSDGRSQVDVWGDGAYYVRLIDADGTLIADANHVQVGDGSAATIPPLQSGLFLTNNGSLLVWQEVREVPDPTGQGGKILGTDGEVLLWQPPPEDQEIPKPDIEVTAAKFRASGGGSLSVLHQVGSASAPASGTKATTTSVTFPEAFKEAPRVFITNTTGYPTVSGDVLPAVAVTSRSTTGFTVTFSTQTSNKYEATDIVTPIAFDWLAVGTVASPSNDPPVTPA